jgi:predicted Zn-dependent protease with MMP-like domain
MHHSRRYDRRMIPFECDEDEFAALAGAELDALPAWIQEAIARDNVAIDIEDERSGNPRTLGLFRSQQLGRATMNEITLYRLPIIRAAGDRARLRGAIHDTLLHELGHLFGMTEGDMDGYTIGNNPRPGAQPVHPAPKQ